ncbi:hypothetical protein J6590_006662 [Homalodisca vitripennis]|nr:hypothetical protein J6590_006662 [Homalodisca vitripennis]
MSTEKFLSKSHNPPLLIGDTALKNGKCRGENSKHLERQRWGFSAIVWGWEDVDAGVTSVIALSVETPPPANTPVVADKDHGPRSLEHIATPEVFLSKGETRTCGQVKGLCISQKPQTAGRRCGAGPRARPEPMTLLSQSSLGKAIMFPALENVFAQRGKTSDYREKLPRPGAQGELLQELTVWTRRLRLSTVKVGLRSSWKSGAKNTWAVSRVQ